jgi:hypothetical protein
MNKNAYTTLLKNTAAIFAETFVEPPRDTSPTGLQKHAQYVQALALIASIENDNKNTGK